MTFSIEKECLTAFSPDGQPLGYITFPRLRAGLVNISQVTIFPVFRGMGIEKAMMDALLTHLDKSGLKAVLTCVQAQQYVQEHPEWKKILPDEIHFTKY